ncbi:MAG: tRNA epoxyqueuosine(34) reductase QueG [Leptospiraceae bacterium]|nr:tRNA epoxyqueuosine(34) reductase QueG [Leptospiraceae bacterium]
MIENKELESIIFELGFSLFGITKAMIPDQDKSNIEEWISRGLHGEMSWFPKQNSIRLNFENLGFVPKSVIVLGVVYISSEYELIKKKFPFRFTRYAVGEDYHKVIRKKVKPVLNYLKSSFPNHHFRQGVDSLPISEKVLAREAGLGWIGKHTNLINSEIGSYFFLSCILTDLVLEYNSIVADRCGTCTTCLDACPTNALFEPYKIDATKCISYLTIENKKKVFDKDESEKLNQWIYGCDICQEVCPWNKVKQERKGIFSHWKEFSPLSIFEKDPNDFLNMEEEEFSEWTKKSAVDRISFEQWKRNIDTLTHQKSE